MTDAGRRRLGRGLEALLGPTASEVKADGPLLQLAISAIRPNPYQPRHVFDEAALNELQESMRANGLLQPVVVRSAEGGAYELVAGERRYRAAERLGWAEIPAVVKEVDDRTLLALALVENLQRDQLSPLDEAHGYARLMADFGAAQADVAALVGRNRSTVANALRLLKLPDAVQELVHTGQLSTGHARALLQLEHPDAITRLAHQAVERDLSVREVEEQARGGRTPKRRPRGRAARRPNADAQRVEDALRKRLKTDVFVTVRGKGGRITVNFYSNDDLARLLELVLGKPYDG